MISQVLIISCLLFCLLCAIMALCLGIYCLISIKAIEKSTHRIEMVPLDRSWAQSEKELKELEEEQQAELPELDDSELDDWQKDAKNLI